MSKGSQKGGKFQRLIQSLIIKAFPDLNEFDVVSTPSGVNGEDIQLSPRAREQLPISAECKHYAKIAVYGWYKQCVANSKGHEPVLFIKQNHSKPLAVVDAEYFMQLQKRASQNLPDKLNIEPKEANENKRIRASTDKAL